MYRLILVFVFAVMFNFSARAEEVPYSQPTEVLKAWIPIGFDSNDRTQILIDGILPSTCYRVGSYSARVDGAAKVISLRQNVDSYHGLCLQMIIPFTQTVNIGHLDSGEYTIVDETSGRNLGSLPISRAASPMIDDFIYSNVHDVRVNHDLAAGTSTLVGDFDLPTRCTRFKEAVVHYYPEVIVVQPILERIGGKVCGTSNTRAKFSVPLKNDLHGTFLLHVRSINGQAINKLVDFE